MLRPEIVRRKLSHLDGYLDELDRYRDVDSRRTSRPADRGARSSG